MDANRANPLTRFEPQKTNYPLVAAVVALFGVLLVGLVMAIRGGDLAASIFFLAAAAVFVILILVHFAEKRREAAVDDR
jgi:hypothetical protein